MHLLIHFFADEVGSTAIEYALIASLVSVGAMGAYLGYQAAADAVYGKITTSVTSTTGS